MTTIASTPEGGNEGAKSDDVEVVMEKEEKRNAETDVAPLSATEGENKRSEDEGSEKEDRLRLLKMFWPLCWPVPPFVEACMRQTAGAFLAYSLTYADIPNAIPPAYKTIVGIIGAVLAMKLPSLAATAGAMVPIMVIAILFSLGSVTMLLAAATVSEAAFVGVASAWIVWMSGLRYGKFGKLTGGPLGFVVVFAFMLATGYERIVRDGVTITVDSSLLPDFPVDPGQLPSGLEDFFDIILQALKVIASLVAGGDGIEITIDEGPLEGGTANISLLPDGDLSINIEGGIWLVKEFWKQSGLENPLAVMRNFAIAWCWALLCAVINPLLPPLHTVRKAASQKLLPAALRDAARCFAAHNSNEEETDTPKDDDDDNKEMKAIQGRLVSYANALHGGSMAFMTAFEPRLLDYRCKPPACTWKCLKTLMEATEEAVIAALSVHHLSVGTSPFLFQQTAGVLEDSATALVKHKKMTRIETDEEESTTREGDENANTPKDDFALDHHLTSMTDRVTMATNAWIESLNPEESSISREEGRKNLLSNVLPWLMPPLLFGFRLIELLLLPFFVLLEERHVSSREAFHAIKFAGGWIALLCMVVYWDAFRDFEIDSDTSSISDGGISVSVPSGTSQYAGWVLISYTFASMPTTEGTVKKCVLRLIGTCLGAFSGWLALTATPHNVYGMVAWLTITFFLAALAACERDPTKALTGQSQDYGYGGFYFVLTQTVIAMHYLDVGDDADNDDRDEIVVNRLVSNCTGILMATVMAVIPPTLEGGDPRYAMRILNKMKETLMSSLHLLLSSNGQSLEELGPKCINEVNVLRTDTLYLVGDAKRFKVYPFYKVDPALEKEIASMTITGALLAIALDHADSIVKDEDQVACFASGTALRLEVHEVLAELYAEDIPNGGENQTSAAPSNSESELFMQAVHIIKGRLFEHESNLAQVNLSWSPTKWAEGKILQAYKKCKDSVGKKLKKKMQ